MEQLFGAGNQVDGIKQWDSYEVESQKYLQIGEWAGNNSVSTNFSSGKAETLEGAPVG